MIIGLTHVAIRVTNIEKSLDFYSRVLGLPEQFRLTREDGGVGLVYLRVGPDQFIELFPGGTGPYEAPTTAAPVHLCLQVDDIEKTHEELLSRGLEKHSPPKLGADGSWQFWTSDPDGNQIEFHQFTEESMQRSSARD